MRKLFWVTLSFSAAIFLSVYLLPEPYLLPAGIFCAVTGITTLFLQENTRRKVALAAFGLCAGFLWTSCYTALFRTPAHAMASKEALVCTVTVLDHPSETDNGYSLPVRLTGPNGRPYKVLLYADEAYASLGPGDEISLPLRLSKSDVLRGERFDYYDARGIYLIGYPKGKILTLRHPDTLSLRFLPQQAAHALKTSITRIFPQDVAPFLIALTTGDKGSLPAGLYAAFQRGGVAHIVAVSGLHVSFLIGLLSALFGKRSKLTFGLGVTLIFFFVLLTGASPSALRAAFMIFFVLLAPLTGREEDRPTTFTVILTLLLFLNPYSVSSVSLQLSFAAVAGIYSLTPILYSRWVKALPEGEHQLTKLFFCFMSGGCRCSCHNAGCAPVHYTPHSSAFPHAFSAGPCHKPVGDVAGSPSFRRYIGAQPCGIAFPQACPSLCLAVGFPRPLGHGSGQSHCPAPFGFSFPQRCPAPDLGYDSLSYPFDLVLSSSGDPAGHSPFCPWSNTLSGPAFPYTTGLYKRSLHHRPGCGAGSFYAALFQRQQRSGGLRRQRSRGSGRRSC